jgi:hypothetical protein
MLKPAASASPQWLAYQELFRRQTIFCLRESDIPVDHAVSLGLPTRRWHGPGYAFLASPAVRRPGAPVEQQAPDRWWVLDARTARLIVYSLTAAVPFAPGEQWSTVTLPPPTHSVQEQAALHGRLADFFDRLASAFFQGEPGDTAWRQAFTAELAAAIPAPLLPQYQALVPDFFAWLAA